MADFKSVSLADQVFDKLENDIIVGIYPRGEVLTELKLVEQLGVSRTPIREALRRLEQERLIADSGKGSIVLGITEDDLLDIMNIRESVEGLAAYYATVNMTEEGRAELLHIVDLQDKKIIVSKNITPLVNEPEGIDIHGKWVYLVLHTPKESRHSVLYRFNLK